MQNTKRPTSRPLPSALVLLLRIFPHRMKWKKSNSWYVCGLYGPRLPMITATVVDEPGKEEGQALKIEPSSHRNPLQRSRVWSRGLWSTTP